MFIGSSHLLTFDRDGALTCWTLPKCQAEYTMKVESNALVLLSPGRHAFLVAQGISGRMMNALTGECQGVLRDPATTGAGSPFAMAFRSDGAAVAGSYPFNKTNTTLVEWDLESGKVRKEIWVPHMATGLAWCGPSLLAMRTTERSTNRFDAASFHFGKLLVVDLELQRTIWQYAGEWVRDVFAAPGDRYWYYAPSNILASVNLIAARLPDEKAAKMISAVPADKPLLAAKSKVRLTVEVTPARTVAKVDVVRKLLRDNYAQILTANDWTQDDKAPVELKVSLKERIGDPNMVLYRSSIRPYHRGGTAMVIHPIEVECELSVEDKSTHKKAWSIAKTTSYEREFETLRLNEWEQQLPADFLAAPWKAAIRWAKEQRVPATIFAANHYNALGGSSLTFQGAGPPQMLLEKTSKP